MKQFRQVGFSTLALMAVLTLARPAHAQEAVFDVASFGELVDQVQSSGQQLTQEEQQLNAQLAMLKSLPSSIVPGVGQLATQTQSLMQQIQGIENEGTSLQSQIENLYPSNFSNLDTVQGVINEMATMQGSTKSAYQSSMALQNQVAANQPQITAAVQAADNASMSASGPTSAIQSTNQLLGTMSQQLGDQQSLLIAAARASEQQQLEAQSDQAAVSQAATASLTPASSAGEVAVNPFPDVGN